MHISITPDTRLRVEFPVATPQAMKSLAFASSILPFPAQPRRTPSGGYAVTSQWTPTSIIRLLKHDPTATTDDRAGDAARQYAANMRHIVSMDPSMLPVYQQMCNLHYTPWEHQARAIEFGRGGGSVYYSMGMGTGKSLVTVALSQYLKHKRTLIVCPSPVVGVWPREYDKHGDGSCHVIRPKGKSIPQRIEHFNTALNHYGDNESVVLVANYEMLRNPAAAKWAAKNHWDLIVADEAHRTKSPMSHTSKALSNLWPVSGQRLCLSGTPMPHSPLDLFAQCRFLDPGLFGTSWVRFRSRYAQLGFFKNVEKIINQEELAELFGMISFKVDDSVVELPEATHSYCTFKLKPATMKAYGQLHSELAAQLDSGVVTAQNALVKSLRLQQLTSGFFYDEAADVYRDMEDQSKLDTLRESIEDMELPIVVFCRYQRDVDRVVEMGRNMRLRVGQLTGQHSDMLDDATMPTDVDLFVVNIASGGVGIDLTRAASAVMFSVNWSAGDFDQALKRLHRPGQKRSVRFLHLIAEDTIDEILYEAIRSKRDLQSAILSYIGG